MIRRLLAAAIAFVAFVPIAIHPAPADAAPQQLYTATVYHGDISKTVTLTDRSREAVLARAWSQCNAANDVCIWQHSNGNSSTAGWFAHWSHGWIYGQPNRCYNLPVGYRNGTSSAGNESPYLIYLKADLYCGGGSYTVYQGTNINTTGFNDVTDSILATNQL